MFTSGTTGLPKGVTLTHRNILFVAEAVRQYLSITPEDRYAVLLPLSHTYGKSNLLSAMAGGAATVLVENFHDYGGFFTRLSEHRCSLASVVPFHLNVIAKRGFPPEHALTHLRVVTTSGGSLRGEIATAIQEMLPDVDLFSMYGLTEASTRVSFLEPSLLTRKGGSVGRPLPGVQVEIRNEDGRALPTDAVGEVAVRGPNVMRGYYGEPELTARTIVNGWLLTGDLGRLDPDGFLYIEGRIKEIIKVAGERISSAEIEAVLCTHPGVADAAVIGVPDALLGETVHAYVVPRREGDDLANLTRYCSEHLPHFKVPRRIVRIGHIPRTATGKIRTHLLRGADCGT